MLYSDTLAFFWSKVELNWSFGRRDMAKLLIMGEVPASHSSALCLQFYYGKTDLLLEKEDTKKRSGPTEAIAL